MNYIINSGEILRITLERQFNNRASRCISFDFIKKVKRYVSDLFSGAQHTINLILKIRKQFIYNYLFSCHFGGSLIRSCQIGGFLTCQIGGFLIKFSCLIANFIFFAVLANTILEDLAPSSGSKFPSQILPPKKVGKYPE